MQPATRRQYPLAPHQLINMCSDVVTGSHGISPQGAATRPQDSSGRTSGINCCLGLLQLAYDVLQAGVLWPIELLTAWRYSQVSKSRCVRFA